MIKYDTIFKRSQTEGANIGGKYKDKFGKSLFFAGKNYSFPLVD
ncbi:MAG: hypothetical protein ACE5KJ_06100 [Candidatus Zixiibacteriota bacterium]